jgi:hypothetical protein
MTITSPGEAFARKIREQARAVRELRDELDRASDGFDRVALELDSLADAAEAGDDHEGGDE